MRRLSGWTALPLLALAAFSGCRSEFEGGGDLRARRVVLRREVDGLRELLKGVERGQSLVPRNDVAISIDESLVRDLIVAQLPFEMDAAEKFHISLREAELLFRGSPVVRLKGSLVYKERPDFEAAIAAVGALTDIEVVRETGTLRARIVVDHLGIEKAGGLESIVSGAALDELARTIRLQLKDQLPPIQIPVKLQQKVELPAVTNGPVRIDGAVMPIEVAVSRVFASNGNLWIAIRFAPGELVKTADAPPAGDTKPSDMGGDVLDLGAAPGEAKKDGKGAQR
jgi:hypothetical protein